MTNGARSDSLLDLTALARAHIEAVNNHSVEAVMSTLADGGCYRVFPGGEELHGAPDLRQFWTATFKRIPDIHIELQHLMKDDRRGEVFVRGTLTGKDTDSPCLEPGDDYLRQQVSIFCKFDGSGKIAEAISYPETSGLDLYALARAHVETENRIDLDPSRRAELAVSTVADDAYYLIYPTAQELRGKDQIHQYYKDSFTALPDMHIDIQHMMKDEQKRQVVCQYRITGLDKGHLQGLLPTNRRIEYYGNILYEF
ncbi:MAG TPA: nuclear transport factor 2 family protein, partial [Blastocatellia bacterium]|nr:nuclear transport factor 2 family protein [Blastocatellia bacterium]